MAGRERKIKTVSGLKGKPIHSIVTKGYNVGVLPLPVDSGNAQAKQEHRSLRKVGPGMMERPDSLFHGLTGLDLFLGDFLVGRLCLFGKGGVGESRSSRSALMIRRMLQMACLCETIQEWSVITCKDGELGA